MGRTCLQKKFYLLVLVNPNPLVYKEIKGVEFYSSLPQCRRLVKVCVCDLGVEDKRLGFSVLV